MLLRLPHWSLRKAVWDRLTSSEATCEHTLRRDGERAALPYLELGPLYLGARGAGVVRGAEIVAQVDAFALVSAGGARVATEMLDDVTQALTEATLELPGGGGIAKVVTLEAAQLQIEYDQAADEEIAHGLARYRFSAIIPPAGP